MKKKWLITSLALFSVIITACSKANVSVNNSTPSKAQGIYDNLKESEVAMDADTLKDDIEDLLEQRKNKQEVGDLALDKDVEKKKDDSTATTTTEPEIVKNIATDEDGNYVVASKGDLRPYVDLSTGDLNQDEFDMMKAVAVELYTRELNKGLKADRYVVVEGAWEEGDLEELDNPVLFDINEGVVTLCIKLEVFDSTENKKTVEVKRLSVGYDGDIAQLR